MECVVVGPAYASLIVAVVELMIHSKCSQTCATNLTLLLNRSYCAFQCRYVYLVKHQQKD